MNIPLRSATLIRQPYGAVAIDPRAKVHFLNETAAETARALIDGCATRQAAERIALIYDISSDEAEADILEFIQYSEIGPLLTGRSQSDWLVTGSDEFTSIVEADISLTARCNLECTYCYAEAARNRNGDLSVREWLDAVRALVRLGMRKVTVAGGEPTMSKVLFPVLKLLAENGVAIQLFTNGLLLTPTMVKRLRDIPINFVQVSLDSANPNYHNRYRGPSHALALRAIKLLIKEGIPVVIGANIFPDSLEEVAALAELAESLGATLRCNPIEARGRGSQFADKMTVVNESFIATLAATVQEASERRPHVFADQEVRRTIEASERVCPFLRGCISVTASAEIRPCSQSDTFFQSVAPWAIDHKKVWEYSQTIEEHVAFKTIAQIQTEVCPTRESCANCSKYPICAGCLLAGHTCQKERR